MGDTAIAPPPPDQQPSESFFSKAFNVFISPGQAFESIARRPDFLAPLIVMTVSSIVIIEAMLEKVGIDRIIRRSLELSGRGAQMTPEQIDQAIQKAGTITAVSMRAGAVIGVPIYLLVIAAVGLLIANVIFGGSAKFKTAFSAVCYANLVLLVETVLGILMIFFGDMEQFNADNFLPTTLGFFLNPLTTSKPLYVIASSFDIFRVWFMILASMGLSAATGKKVGTLAIFLTFLAIWVVIVLGHAGIVAAMS